MQILATGKTLHFNNSECAGETGGWDISLQRLVSSVRPVVARLCWRDRPAPGGAGAARLCRQFSRIGDAQRVKTGWKNRRSAQIPKPQAARNGRKAGKEQGRQSGQQKKRR